MSVHVMSLVWASNVPAPERFTLLALADRADEEGLCWPAIGTLAKKCCTGESTIRRHLRSLMKIEVVTVQRRIDNSSIYTINLAKLRDLDQDRQSDTRQSDRGCQSGRGKQRRPAKTDKYPRQSDTPCQTGTPSQIDTGTPVNLSGHPSQIDTQYVSDPSGDPSGGPRKRATRPHRIPDGFKATPDMIAWARENTPLVGQAETEQFIDYWRSDETPKARKKDWEAAWRFWMRRAQKDAERRGGRHLQSVPTTPKIPLDPDSALADIKARCDATSAANLLNRSFIPRAQPPSDNTPPDEWDRERAREFIAQHETELRAALIGRQAG